MPIERGVARVRHCSRAIWTVVGILAITGCLHVTPAPAPSHHFLERNFVFRNSRDTSLLFEGQAAAHLFLVDGLPHAYHRISDSESTATAAAWRVIFTPMFRIRQLKDSSAAVRTPSFMPRISVERSWVTRDSVTAIGGALFFDHARVSGLRVTLAHHSNGQAGCFRQGFEPIDARSNVCRAIPGADTTTIRLNRASGDFSSTFVNVMYHTAWRNGNDRDLVTRSKGIAVSGDVHPPGIFGALSNEQRELYGSWRLRGQGEVQWALGTACDDGTDRKAVARAACYLRGRARVNLEGELAPRHPGSLSRRIDPPVVPYRYTIEASHAFNALLRTGLFIRWHDGQDYYNIGFAQRRRFFVIGMMLDVSGADRIGKRIAQ